MNRVVRHPADDDTNKCFGLFCTTGDEASANHKLPVPFHPHNNNNNINNSLLHNSRFLVRDEDGLTIADRQTKKETDDLLSQALNGLSFEERQEQQEVLHGVDAGKITEDETFLKRSLDELDDHLSSIKQGSMYELAETMDPTYVSNRAFRLMFLRGNEYDPKAAAAQMLKFFESKHQLFGATKLVQEITIRDLDEDDIACLKAGWVQQAGRDRSGRQVFIKFAGLFRVSKWSKTIWNDLRVQYFVVMNALMQSEKTQIRGTVSIWYGIGDSKTASHSNGTRNELLQVFQAARCLPQKKAATHICTDDMREYVLCNVMIQIMKQSSRARLRLHFGSLTECQYQLLTYGIVPGLLPVHDTDGSVNPIRHLLWIMEQQQQQQQQAEPPNHTTSSHDRHHHHHHHDNTTTTTIIISTPNPNDVLCTGGKNSHHFGNQLFRTLAFDCVPLYYAADITAGQKAQLVHSIIDKIHGYGGRFLRPQQQQQQQILPQQIPNGNTNTTTTTTNNKNMNNILIWEPVPMDELKIKIMQTFRNRRRRLEVIQDRKEKKKKKAQQQQLLLHNNNNNCATTTPHSATIIDGGTPIIIEQQQQQLKESDVLFGGGGRTKKNKHKGNEFLQALVKQHSVTYESLTRGCKMKLVESIMEEIQSRGGRFLLPTTTTSTSSGGGGGQCYVQVSTATVKERISKQFRNNRRTSRGKR